MPHITIDSRKELFEMISKTRHRDFKDSQEGEQIRTCPHCGIGRQKRQGQGKYRYWTPCDYPLCKAQPIDKKIRIK